MFSGKIFRSRWAALLWAAGIIWTAYDVADANTPSHDHAKAQVQQTQQAQPTDGASAVGVSDQDLAILKQYADGN